MELTENELATLENLVANKEEWNLIKKFFAQEIALFWDTLRLTDPADSKRIVTNHSLAVGVEASLGDIIKEMEAIAYIRQHPTPKELPDQTAEFLQ